MNECQTRIESLDTNIGIDMCFIPPLYTFKMSTNVLQMEDWVHVLRYVPILQDHSSVVVMLGILYLDMPALVRNTLMTIFCLVLFFIFFNCGICMSVDSSILSCDLQLHEPSL